MRHVVGDERASIDPRSSWTISEDTLQKLPRVLGEASIDWRSFSFADGSAFAGHAALQGLQNAEAAPELELLAALKAYQRLLRVLPAGAEAYALPLLAAGVHSAIQIAELPRAKFAQRWAELFPDQAELGERVYRQAVTRRIHLALHHVQKAELHQPHYNAARFR